jgi:signal transduction histidine kinase
MRFYVAEGPGAEAAKIVPLPAGAGICGHVVRTGQPIILNDAQNDTRIYRKVDQATGMTTRNILCVPIRSSQRLWGVLELINKHGSSVFTGQDMLLAEVVAAETGLALENFHLHEEIIRNERMAAIGQTVSGLAHCIKNILNGIRSGSVVVDRAVETTNFEQVCRGWKTVRRNNEMLSNLVLDMLALARESTPHPFPTDINDLTRQVCNLLAEDAKQRNLVLTCVDAPDLPEIALDPTYFYRCLLNLVSNALDACQSEGHVRVRVHRGNRRPRFTISVTDDGQGIDPEHRGKLFEGFFTTKGGKGTGLGLPVTKKLIGQMGGNITFHSVCGKGTRFVFSLPIPEESINK